MHLEEPHYNELSQIQHLLKEQELCHEDLTMDKVRLFKGINHDEWVGFGGFEPHGTTGLFRSLVVMDEHRRQGFGLQLTVEIINKARQEGIEELYLLTLSASDFFLKLGFTAIDRSEVPEVIRQTYEYGVHCKDNAVCMRKTLQKQ